LGARGGVTQFAVFVFQTVVIFGVLVDRVGGEE
jgi:hypothetical protein